MIDRWLGVVDTMYIHVAGLKCRDLTYDVSSQCRGCGVISRFDRLLLKEFV